MVRIEKLTTLVDRYYKAKENNELVNASEETMRMWINELLGLFGWNVLNTREILQENTLAKEERQKLHNIGSTYVKPDYTMVNGDVRLAFVDAKKLTVSIQNDSEAAFQIRSYGWSIGAPFSIITNFEELAVYDCSVMPKQSDGAAFARILYIKANQFVEHYAELEPFLLRESVINGVANINRKAEEQLDRVFATYLGRVRINLAESIYNCNPGITMSELSLWTQIIINRILFIRVCESRGLEEEGLLLSYAETDFWQKFRNSSYLTFYNHYDGPLFAKLQPIHNLKIDNQVFMEFLSYLYYPSPYCFDVIPLKSISDIYDLFLRYQLVVKLGRIVDELRIGYTKSAGVATTPETIVRRVIDSTITPEFLSNLNNDQLLKLRIVDPACGSGVFLIGVYETIAKQYIKNIVDGKSPSDNNVIPKGYSYILSLEGKKTIINNCLFGVDINQEAVEVAKLSLSLKIVDGYEPGELQTAGLMGSLILNGIGSNVKCGNSLVSHDILVSYPNLSDDLEEYCKTNIFEWEEAFPSIFQNGGFDFVVGNPPYVEVKNYNIELPTMASYIKDKYPSSALGKVDLAIPFIEKGIRLLNEDGHLGYIVQKRFFKTEYGKELRRIISSNILLERVFDYKETNLFSGAITYVAVLVCGKNKSDHVLYQNSSNNDVIEIPVKIIDEQPWNFEDHEIWELSHLLAERCGKLETLCKVKVGIQVLWGNAYHIKVDHIKNGIIYGSTKIDENVVIEEDACRPLLCNERIEAFAQPNVMTYAIFPYKIVKKKAVRIPFSKYSEKYPHAGKYLSKHRNLIELTVETEPNRKPKLNKDEYWHVYTRGSHLEDNGKKVCVPMTAQEPIATCLDKSNMYCDNANMFYLDIKDATEERKRALAAIINSTPFATLARFQANPQSGGYYKFSKQFLDPVPFPIGYFIADAPEIKKLSELGHKIEKIMDMSKDGNNAERFKPLLNELWQEIDSLVLKMYGANKSEAKLLISQKRKDR